MEAHSVVRIMSSSLLCLLPLFLIYSRFISFSSRDYVAVLSDRIAASAQAFDRKHSTALLPLSSFSFSAARYSSSTCAFPSLDCVAEWTMSNLRTECIRLLCCFSPLCLSLLLAISFPAARSFFSLNRVASDRLAASEQAFDRKHSTALLSLSSFSFSSARYFSSVWLSLPETVSLNGR
jgi:hypothetical protein